ncbi:MAG TPA: amidase [Methylomirabilota bacterium]|nr:amidase [Methylomirabilota bacterium]
MTTLHELTASEAARRIRTGAISPSNLLAALLKRIDAVEPTVRAWVHLDRDAAARVAVQRDMEAREGRFMGALHGVPVALKDIFDAAGLVTTAGAGPFAHRTATADAASVARLRAAGAVVLGKVTTTAFAFLDPSPTRNPWNPEHTPGGSSSGPAAAVAARMAPLALGSQTVGSVLRPAAYCGVVGLKPTHGRISAAGVVPLSWSLDHVGIFSRRVEDCALALGLLAGADAADPLSSAAGVDDYAGAVAAAAPPRIGVLRPLFERATPDMAAHVEATARALEKAGATLVDVALPASFAGLHEAGSLVLRAEAAAWHTPLFTKHAGEYPPRIREAIEAGRGIPAVDYLAAQESRRAFRRDMAPLTGAHDALLTPTVGAPAPKGLGSTGDPYFCAPWSFAGLPAIALPSGVDAGGLPLSIQLVGAAFAEARLLGAAAWCERVIGFDGAPSL